MWVGYSLWSGGGGGGVGQSMELGGFGQSCEGVDHTLDRYGGRAEHGQPRRPQSGRQERRH